MSRIYRQVPHSDTRVALQVMMTHGTTQDPEYDPTSLSHGAVDGLLTMLSLHLLKSVIRPTGGRHGQEKHTRNQH